MATIRIDPEFRALIPNLSKEERLQLEDNLQRDGCRDPLVVWKGQLLDGHNRYEICEERGYPYRVVDQLCADRDAAKIWIIKNQFGRRNLTPLQRIALARELEPLIAIGAMAHRAHGITAPGKTLPANLPKALPIDTREEVARLAGVSPRTYDKGKVVLDRATDDVKRDMMSADSKTSIDKAYRDIVEPEKRAAKIDAIVAQSVAPVEQSDRRYPVIYADPPWRYEHVKTESRAIENQYPTMALGDICGMRVSELALDDAILFLWATSPKLAEALRVVEAWGFTYRTSMVWVKDQIGMGYYARQRHELLLICTRGELPTPAPADRPDSVVNAPRSRHSEKPAVFYEVIERMYPTLPKIELFCRSPRNGWAAWGNQAVAS